VFHPWRAEYIHLIAVFNLAREDRLDAFEFQLPSGYFNFKAFVYVHLHHAGEFRGCQMHFDRTPVFEYQNDVRTNPAADRALAIRKICNPALINGISRGVVFGHAFPRSVDRNTGRVIPSRRIPIRRFISPPANFSFQSPVLC